MKKQSYECLVVRPIVPGSLDSENVLPSSETFACMGLFFLYVYLSTIYVPDIHGDQKKIESPGTDAVSHHVGPL